VRTLVVVDDVSEVVSAAVVCLAHAHGVVREVHIAVVALYSVLDLVMFRVRERAGVVRAARRNLVCVSTAAHFLGGGLTKDYTAHTLAI
jgi:hypothetical protein